MSMPVWRPRSGDRPRKLPALSQERLDDELARLPREVTSAIGFYMHSHGISRVDLAETIGVSASRVSQILSGDENLTLRTIATLTAALGCTLDIALVPPSGSDTAAAATALT